MPEKIFNENIDKLQNIYSVLVKGDVGPGKESEYRVAIIDMISNAEAAIVGVKNSNKEFIALLAKLRENVLSWNAQGSIFKQQIDLLDQFNEFFFKAKSVVFTPVVEEITKDEVVAEKEVVEENNNKEATRLKKELASMKNELGELKNLINSLMKEKEKQNDIALQQPAVIEQPQEAITPVAPEEPKSQLPWRRETKTEESKPEPLVTAPEVTQEPPIILPIVSEEKQEVETPAPIVEEATPDMAAFEASATIQKLSQTQKQSTNPAQVIDQMKSIITEAEEETRKEISAFKDSLEEETKPPITPIEDQLKEMEKITPPIIEPEVTEVVESAVAKELDTPIIPPTEPAVEEIPEEPEADPYMQLLTLEAEKYRLEKEIEKNETDFQEGLKNRQEFDENITQINDDLAKVREHIDLLRKQLIT